MPSYHRMCFSWRLKLQCTSPDYLKSIYIEHEMWNYSQRLPQIKFFSSLRQYFIDWVCQVGKQWTYNNSLLVHVIKSKPVKWFQSLRFNHPILNKKPNLLLCMCIISFRLQDPSWQWNGRACYKRKLQARYPFDICCYHASSYFCKCMHVL